MVIELQFTAEEWREIYYALEAKSTRIKDGHYGSAREGVSPKKWAEKLDEIAERIADEVKV